MCSGFRKRSCPNKKLEWDDDSKKSHPTLGLEKLCDDLPRAITLVDLGPVSALGQHVQLAARNQALHQHGALGDGAAILGAP